MKKTVFFLAMATLFSLASPAQVISTKNISLDAAKKIVAQAVQFAKDNKAPGGAIAVVDAGGSLVYLERLDNTFSAASMEAGKRSSPLGTRFCRAASPLCTKVR